MELVGCSREDLVDHLESRLDEGEHLKDKHIDHIFPFAIYDLSDPEMQRRVMHYSNMQPLDGPSNQHKSDKLPLKWMAAFVEKWAWPPGVTMEDLPTSY